MSHKPLVSVVIPTFNSGRFLERCLRSVRAQTYEHVEIIVVDNYSTDKTKDITKKYKGRIITAKSERARAKNLGAEASHGKYVLFLDSDMVVEPNVIGECIKIVEGDEKLRVLIIPERSIGNSFWVRVRDFERSLYQETEIESPRFFEKDLIMKGGGFDEAIVFFEESSLPQKLEALGCDTKARVDSMIYHLEDGFSLNKWLVKKYYYGKSAAIYQEKYKNYATNKMNLVNRLRLFLSNKAFYCRPHLAFSLLILKSFEFLLIKMSYFMREKDERQFL
jgi:glycosyltransferase involved in cell wall biosynthesis